MAEDGREFYVEVADFDRHQCSDFVKAQVLSQIGHRPACMVAHQALPAALHTWLDPYALLHPEVCYDFLRDWQLMRKAMACRVPSWLTYRNVWSAVDPDRKGQFWRDSGLTPHHALHDARCLAFATGHAIGTVNGDTREGIL